MKTLTHAIILITLLVTLISCNKKAQAPIPEPEVLSVFWENATLNMHMGEVRELRWNSNYPIQPKVYCEGSAVAIIGMTHNGVRIRAIESGIDMVSLFIEEKEILCVVTVNDDVFVFDYEEPEYVEFENAADNIPANIIIPYAKEYLSPGQETSITVRLENGNYGDEMQFRFTAEPGKNSIEVNAVYNVAGIKAIGEGEQYIRVSHPKARESKFIVYDVLPPSPPPPPNIDVNESPMIIKKGETKPLHMLLLNGNPADREKFQFQVIENAYAIEVRRQGNILHVTGIAPGAGKIRLTNPAALRDYDVMVIVD